MPFQIDTSSIDFNLSNSGFNAAYIPVDPSTEPADCTLPPLTNADLALPDTSLTSLTPGCKFNFQTVFPIPPVFVPKVVIPPIPCPSGTTITSSVTIEGTGSAIASGTIEMIGGPCNFALGGGINIFVPPIPCPEGTSISGEAKITTSGIAVGGGSISVLGGPCNFEIVGNIDIFVPPIAAGGGGVSPGSAVSCPSSVASLFTVDPTTGDTIISMPVPCFNCSTPTSPFQIRDIPNLNSIKLATIDECSCCSGGGTFHVNACLPEIDMSGGSNSIVVNPNNAAPIFISGSGSSVSVAPNQVNLTDSSGNDYTSSASNGKYTSVSGNYLLLDGSFGIGVVQDTLTNTQINQDSIVLKFNGSTTVTVSAAIANGIHAGDITFREITICADDGSTQKMIVLASAPY